METIDPSLSSRWLADFQEVTGDLLEEAVLLEALSEYCGDWPSYLSQEVQRGAFRRLSGYLLQHTADLERLYRQIGTRQA